MSKILKIFLKKIGFVIILGAFSFFAFKIGFFYGKESILKTPPPYLSNIAESSIPIDFSIFWEAWRKLENSFLENEKINYQKMIYGAIKGMVQSLEDPYTSFFTPKEAKEFEQEMSGEYEGVGMLIGIKDNQITVISPFKGTPAFKAGLKPLDKILKIDDKFTKGMPLDKAASLIKGPKGTKVKLLILREDWQAPKEFLIERATIKIPTLEWEIKNKDIAIIKIYQFNSLLLTEFKKAAFEILNSPAKKIILDLRNNPGGYLEVASEIAGFFLKKGEIIVWQKTKEKKKPYKSKGPALFLNYPTVVLINGGTASGAEILAGALKDNRKVPLVGEKSFGKGSVQEPIVLSDNSFLKVTIAKWLTPSGELIEEKGLTPDFEVKMDQEDEKENRDPQLEKAIEILTKIK